MNSKTTIFWFRRDLRLKDNAGLYHAQKKKKNIIPLFIFDSINYALGVWVENGFYRNCINSNYSMNPL